MTLRHRQKLAWAAAFLALLLLSIKWWPAPPAGFAITDPPPGDKTPYYKEQFITFNETPTVHAPSITQQSDGKLIAAWYAGTEEGAQDVEISATTIDPDSGSISPVYSIASRRQTEKDSGRYIRKLGNPVIYTLPDTRLMLVYVSVSFGGWAASSLNVRFSEDGGKNWSASKRLITSPAINISTLVRNAPLLLDNGDIAIPVYHEFLGKFGELLIMNAQGDIVDKHRITWGRDAIQPTVVPITRNKAIALLRDSGEKDKRVQLSQSDNAGIDWTANKPLSLPNPNAAVAAIRLDDNRLIQVFNNHEDERNILSLGYSADAGKTWDVIHDFENHPLVAGEKIKYSYPYLIRGSQGNFHMLYTWRKQRIKYVQFNQAWLEQKL